MSLPDPGENTDGASGTGDIMDSSSTSTSGSSSTGWSLVDEQGMLQDDDIESTGSSVEVMEGFDDDEEVEPVTPVGGNSPPGNVRQPLFVLRLYSCEVPDTDEEGSVETSTDVTDSPLPSTPDTVSLSSSDLRSSQSTGETEAADSALGSQESSSASPLTASTVGQQVTPEHIESLRRAIDDVQSSLMQPNSDSTSLSSWEMFGEGRNDSECSLTSSGTLDTETMSGHLQTLAMKGDKSAHQQINAYPRVTSLERDATQQENEEDLDSLDGESSGTVVPLQQRGMDEVMPDTRPLLQRIVRRQSQDRCERLCQWILHDRWFLGSYILVISLMVLVAGFNIYYALSQMDGQKYGTIYMGDKTPEVKDHCESDLSLQQEYLNLKQDLQTLSHYYNDKEQQLAESAQKVGNLSLQRDTLQAEKVALLNQVVALQEELNSCRETRDTYILAYGSSRQSQKNLPDVDTHSETGYPSHRPVLHDAGTQAVTGKPLKRDNVEDILPLKINEDKRGQTGEESDEKKVNTEDNTGENNQKEDNVRQVQKGKSKRKQKKEERSIESEEQKAESNRKNDGSEIDSFGPGSQWMNTIFDVMNITNSLIADTWHQVRNVSEQLWKEHSPTLERMQNKFTKKFQHLGKKFSEKLMKKAKKWFKMSKKSSDKPDENQSDKGNAETKRRPFRNEGQPKGNNKDEDVTSNPSSKIYGPKNTKCNSSLMKLHKEIKLMSVSKFNQMLPKQQRDMEAQMSAIIRWLLKDKVIGADRIQHAWLKCQSGWWEETADLDDIADCMRYLSCWQIKLVGGDAKLCRKVKRREGNVLDNRCSVGPGPVEDKNREESHATSSCSTSSSCGGPGKDSNGDDDIYYHTGSDDCNDADDRGYNWVDDDEEVEDNDDDDGLWFQARADDRKYHQDEPDSWFYRKAKDYLYSLSDE